MRQHPERILAQQLAEYLQLQFPGVVYRFDLAADLKLSIGQAARHKRLHPVRGFPDLMVFEPRFQFHGLALELKAAGAKVHKPTGGLYADPHLAEQAAYHERLRAKGYLALFGIGFDECAGILSEYLTKSPDDYQLIEMPPHRIPAT